MEQEPDTENVVYLDEYQHLEERVRLRRLGQLTLFSSTMGNTTASVHHFQTPKVVELRPAPPDGAA